MERQETRQTEARTSVEQTLDLVRLAQKGSKPALNRLLERYSARARAIVRVRMGQVLRRRHDSQDLVQETLMTAFQNFDQYQVHTEAGFINWISKIAENRILSMSRDVTREKRDPRQETPLDRPDVSNKGRSVASMIESEITAPLARLIESEQSGQVERAIETLPNPFRELIILRHFAGMSWPEIAREAGRASPAAARVMYTKAMERLKEQL